MTTKTVHVIWHHLDHPSIRDAKECAGVVLTGYQDANTVVDQLNAKYQDRSRDSIRFWKEEFEVLTP